MTQTQLFCLLLVTCAMGVAGTRELHRGNCSLGAMLLLIPAAGWISIMMGKP